MAIITISRELAALGDETARELASQLNYRYVDKNALEDRIKSYGVSNPKFFRYDEKKASFWASISQDRDDYLHFLKSAILDEAGQGSTIFIGRGAGVILKDVPGVFSVFLVAPPEIRLERVKSYFHCDDRRAQQIIDQSDQDRKGFHRYFFDIKWKEAGNYHLALNTGHLHPSVCAEIVKHLRDRTMTEEAEIQNARRIQELTLGQQVKHHILYEKKIPIHFLEASVSGGEPRPAGSAAGSGGEPRPSASAAGSGSQVILYGVTNAQSLIEAALSCAGEVSAGSSVRSEIQIVHEYTVMP